MKFIPEKEKNYIATFLANFRLLCGDAEINDPKETKHLLFEKGKSGCADADEGRASSKRR